MSAETVQVLGRIGIKGVSRVRCKVLEGEDKNKVLVRNVVGPVKKGDVVLLKETAMDSVAKIQGR